ncbi:MAG: DUF1838 family protein [Myxococcales bacterium]|nr:DUF1838 family protein [Myxococcales bacterium]
MRAVAIVSLTLAGCAATRAAPPPPPPVTRTASLDELVRVRCAADATEVITSWTGTVYAYPRDERPRALFDVVGVNVARCLPIDAGWTLTSRELMYYLAPGGTTPLRRWRNPWTDVEVPVVHVANRLVQAPLGGGVPLTIADGRATLSIDVPLFYPNPLAADPALAAYGPSPSYQGGEFFTLSVPAAALTATTAPTMQLTWHRLGPWLPWMQMGDRPGVLLYRASGRKLGSLDELPAFLRAELRDRLPLFAHAPTCVVDARNQTSWTYFAAHLADYLAGAEFPRPAPVDPDECPAAARPHGPAPPP